MNQHVEGMNLSTSLHDEKSRVTIALGYKSPGTQVPMIASYRWANADQSEEGLPASGIGPSLAAGVQLSNQKRRHSFCGGKSPAAYERALMLPRLELARSLLLG